MFDVSDLTPLEITEKRRFSMRHFVVTGDIKSETKPRIGRHLRYSVVCADVRRAIELCEKDYPNAVIHSVADQGAVDKVDNG